MAVFFSCQQTSADIKQTEYSVVFEYKNASDMPEARLCVFIESEENSTRTEKMQISFSEKKYSWLSDSLLKLNENGKYWTGCTNFVMQDGVFFPKGKYTTTVFNADEDSAESDFNLEYNEKFYSLKAVQVKDEMLKMQGIHKIAVYNRDNLLLFYGNDADTMSPAERIRNTYRNGYYYTEIWESKDKSVICILPKQYLLSDENQLN